MEITLFFSRRSDGRTGERTSPSPAPSHARAFLSRCTAGSKPMGSVRRQGLPRQTKVTLGGWVRAPDGGLLSGILALLSFPSHAAAGFTATTLLPPQASHRGPSHLSAFGLSAFAAVRESLWETLSCRLTGLLAFPRSAGPFRKTFSPFHCSRCRRWWWAQRTLQKTAAPLHQPAPASSPGQVHGRCLQAGCAPSGQAASASHPELAPACTASSAAARGCCPEGQLCARSAVSRATACCTPGHRTAAQRSTDASLLPAARGAVPQRGRRADPRSGAGISAAGLWTLRTTSTREGGGELVLDIVCMLPRMSQVWGPPTAAPSLLPYPAQLWS